MKKPFAHLLFLLAALQTVALSAHAQDTDTVRWEVEADANLFFIDNDFILMPVIRADKNKLHLEARYNYEDMQTFSGWIGYNFSGGRKLEYIITPMMGGVVGLSDGIAPGLEVTLAFKRFELYSEAELFFDFEGPDNHYYYNWTDITYSPTDWLWVGISAQRTRLYQTDLDLQRGILVGGGVKGWGITAYFYNVASDNPFLLIALSKTF